MQRPQRIDVSPFGRVECPMFINHDKGIFETFISYDIKDFQMFIKSAYWYYMIKAKKTQRQGEIADLLFKLSKLLEKEKSVVGRLRSPIIFEK